MIFVRLTNPERDEGFMGTDNAKKYLDGNETYVLDFVNMEKFHTEVYLKEFPDLSFNSVVFTFYEEDGTPINIYKDKRFNPFMTKHGQRPSEFYHRGFWG